MQEPVQNKEPPSAWGKNLQRRRSTWSPSACLLIPWGEWQWRWTPRWTCGNSCTVRGIAAAYVGCVDASIPLCTWEVSGLAKCFGPRWHVRGTELPLAESGIFLISVSAPRPISPGSRWCLAWGWWCRLDRSRTYTTEALERSISCTSGMYFLQFHQPRLVIRTFHRQGRCSRGGHLCNEHCEEKYSCSYK